MALKDEPLDFATTMNKALTPPDPGGGEGKDLPDGFPLGPKGSYRLVDTTEDTNKIPGVYEYDYVPHYKGFVVYRPWSACERCKQAIATGAMILPQDDGDIDCPHTQVKDYLAARQLVLEGKAMCDPPEQIVLKDGTVVVTLQWYTYKENHKKRRQAMKASRSAGADGREEPPV